MYELKKIGKVFTSKFVGTGPSSYEKRIYPGRGRTEVEKHCYERSPVSVPLHYRNAQRPVEILKPVAVRKSVFKDNLLYIKR